MRLCSRSRPLELAPDWYGDLKTNKVSFPRVRVLAGTDVNDVLHPAKSTSSPIHSICQSLDPELLNFEAQKNENINVVLTL